MKRVKKTADTTTFNGFLVLGESGTMSIARRRPDLKGGEIACVLEVTVPANIFEYSYPNIKLSLDDASVLHPTFEARAKRLVDKI